MLPQFFLGFSPDSEEALRRHRGGIEEKPAENQGGKEEQGGSKRSSSSVSPWYKTTNQWPAYFTIIKALNSLNVEGFSFNRDPIRVIRALIRVIPL